MDSLTGLELEDDVQQLFTSLGMSCVNRLIQAQLAELNPDGEYGSSEHLEFDFLIPYGDVCVIGEVTARSGPKDVKKKYDRFRAHYNLVQTLPLKADLWSQLGVPTERLREFREVSQLRGCFITTELEMFDLKLGEGKSEGTSVAVLYRRGFQLLKEYASSIGSYAKPYVLDHRHQLYEGETILMRLAKLLPPPREPGRHLSPVPSAHFCHRRAHARSAYLFGDTQRDL